MNYIIILIMILVICCCFCCSIILGGGGYYYVTSKNDKKPNTKTSNQQQDLDPSETPSEIPSETPSTTPSSIVPFYKIENPRGIKEGAYNKIPFNTFGLNDYINNWNITILFKAITNDKFQGIIGNIYNSEITGFENSWGFWINPSKKIQFRISNWFEDLTILGSIVNNTEYKLIINFNKTYYEITLTNMSNNETKTSKITNKPKLNNNKGSICIGGIWPNKLTGEIFEGNITYVDFTKLEIEKSTTTITALYPFKTHTFTNANAIGSKGPTLSDIKREYSSAPWTQDEKFLNMVNDNGIQLWTVPEDGKYRIKAIGAASSVSKPYGKGRDIEVVTNLKKNDKIKILVGQMGGVSVATNDISGGGGGTFVVKNNNEVILVAGGGGSSDLQQDRNSNAAPTNTGKGEDVKINDNRINLGGVNGGAGKGISGGAGFNEDSGVGGGNNSVLDNWSPFYGSVAKSFINGGTGAEVNASFNELMLVWRGKTGHFAVGGFGGGGASIFAEGNAAGGGGGYSGGGGGERIDAPRDQFGRSDTSNPNIRIGYIGYAYILINGGGGGSFSAIPEVVDNGAINNGHGKVVITFVE